MKLSHNEIQLLQSWLNRYPYTQISLNEKSHSYQLKFTAEGKTLTFEIELESPVSGAV